MLRAVLAVIFLTLIPFSVYASHCPEGAYHGFDNQGNPACRTIEGNHIVDPDTGLLFDSQTGEIILNDEQLLYIGIGIIIVIIIIAGIAKASQKKDIVDLVQRHGWSEIEKEQVRIRQEGKCNMCHRPPPRWEYDHTDGNRSNNDLSNCQGLCPNCHSVKTNE